jgi:hypothetical protein
LRGRSPEEIRQGVYQAKKDVIYLFYLHANLNIKVEQDMKALCSIAGRAWSGRCDCSRPRRSRGTASAQPPKAYRR